MITPQRKTVQLGLRISEKLYKELIECEGIMGLTKEEIIRHMIADSVYNIKRNYYEMYK